MGKYAMLFLLLGLAVGLWLGFNPATHRALTRWWNQSRRDQQASGAPAIINAQRLDRQISRWLRTAPQARRAEPPAKPSPVPSGNQISNELQVFWDALHRLWLNLGERLQRATS